MNRDGLRHRHWDVVVLHYGVVAQVVDGFCCACPAVLVAAIPLLVLCPLFPAVEATEAVVDRLRRH